MKIKKKMCAAKKSKKGKRKEVSMYTVISTMPNDVFNRIWVNPNGFHDFSPIEQY